MHWLLWLLRWLLATTDPLGLLLQLACSRSIEFEFELLFMFNVPEMAQATVS